MKALTICQPYAELILRGEKRVENRKWSTNYRGPLLIHSGKSRKFLKAGSYGIAESEMTFGAVLGIAEVIHCLPLERIEKERNKTHSYRQPADFPSHLEFLCSHRHVEGPFCIVLANIRRFDQPVPFLGCLGLFDIPAEIVAAEMEKLP